MIGSLGVISWTALFWIAQALLYGTLLAGLTALGCSLLFRRGRPALHALLWTVVLVRFLLPPVLPTLPYLSEATGWLSLEAAALLPAGTDATLTVGQSAAAPFDVALQSSPSVRMGGWFRIALSLYVVGLILLILRFVRLHLHNRRWLSTLPQADPELICSVRRLADRIGLRKMPTVRVTEEMTSPLVVGALRPQLILSQPLCTALPSDAAEAIVVHELAHILRRDHLVRCLQTVAGLLFYFWLPVHWVSRRIDRAAELACDQWALAATEVAPRDYAESLLSVIRSLSRESNRASQPAFANKRTSMEERFEMILNNRPAFPAKLSWTVVPVLGLWCVFALAGSSPVVSQDDSADPPEKLVVHIRGDVSHLSLKSHLLPEADTDGDGHLSLQELQDFQALYPDRVDLTVEPGQSDRQEVTVQITGHSGESVAAWASAGDDPKPLSVVLKRATEADRDRILAQNPEADTDGDGALSDKELQMFLGSAPARIEVHTQSVDAKDETTRKVLVINPDPVWISEDEGEHHLTPEELLEEFPALDLNGNGVLEPDELAGGLQYLDELQDGHGAGQQVRTERIIVTHTPKARELNPAERRAQFLKDHPEADLDGDGVISKAEAEALASKVRKP